MRENPKSVTKGRGIWSSPPFSEASEDSTALFGAAHLPLCVGAHDSCSVWSQASIFMIPLTSVLEGTLKMTQCTSLFHWRLNEIRQGLEKNRTKERKSLSQNQINMAFPQTNLRVNVIDL